MEDIPQSAVEDYNKLTTAQKKELYLARTEKQGSRTKPVTGSNPQPKVVRQAALGTPGTPSLAESHNLARTLTKVMSASSEGSQDFSNYTELAHYVERMMNQEFSRQPNMTRKQKNALRLAMEDLSGVVYSSAGGYIAPEEGKVGYLQSMRANTVAKWLTAYWEGLKAGKAGDNTTTGFSRNMLNTLVNFYDTAPGVNTDPPPEKKEEPAVTAPAHPEQKKNLGSFLKGLFKSK